MKQLGKYEIIELLGSGATADVYRAHDETMGRDVALKIFKPALVADATTFARFVQEAQAAAGLFHENIATALDSGEIDGNYYIAMRYVTGQSLDRLLKEGGALPWDEALRMTQQIGSALNYAHGHGFLHRDVKPANIIRSNAGNYVLTDFGLAKAMFSSGVTTHTGAVLGTPSYIPPEIWDGQDATALTDEYSLACVLYEALTGITLFTGATPPAVMGSHFKERRFQAQWPAGVPNGVTGILAKALAVLPENRYGSVLEFTAELIRLKPKLQIIKPSSGPVRQVAPAHVPQIASKPEPPQKKSEVRPPRKKLSILWILLGAGVLTVALCLAVPVLINLISPGQITPGGDLSGPTTATLVVQYSQLTQAATVAPAGANIQELATNASPMATGVPILLENCRTNSTTLCVVSFADLSSSMLISLRQNEPFTGQYHLVADGKDFNCQVSQNNPRQLNCTGAWLNQNSSLYFQLYAGSPENLVASGNVIVPLMGVPTVKRTPVVDVRTATRVPLTAMPTWTQAATTAVPYPVPTSITMPTNTHTPEPPTDTPMPPTDMPVPPTNPSVPTTEMPMTETPTP